MEKRQLQDIKSLQVDYWRTKARNITDIRRIACTATILNYIDRLEHFEKHFWTFFRLTVSKSNARATDLKPVVGFLPRVVSPKEDVGGFPSIPVYCSFLFGVSKARDEKAATDVTNPIFTLRLYSLSSTILDLGKPFRDPTDRVN